MYLMDYFLNQLKKIKLFQLSIKIIKFKSYLKNKPTS